MSGVFASFEPHHKNVFQLTQLLMSDGGERDVVRIRGGEIDHAFESDNDDRSLSDPDTNRV